MPPNCGPRDLGTNRPLSGSFANWVKDGGPELPSERRSAPSFRAFGRSTQTKCTQPEGADTVGGSNPPPATLHTGRRINPHNSNPYNLRSSNWNFYMLCRRNWLIVWPGNRAPQSSSRRCTRGPAATERDGSPGETNREHAMPQSDPLRHQGCGA